MPSNKIKKKDEIVNSDKLLKVQYLFSVIASCGTNIQPVIINPDENSIVGITTTHGGAIAVPNKDFYGSPPEMNYIVKLKDDNTNVLTIGMNFAYAAYTFASTFNNSDHKIYPFYINYIVKQVVPLINISELTLQTIDNKLELEEIKCLTKRQLIKLSELTKIYKLAKYAIKAYHNNKQRDGIQINLKDNYQNIIWNILIAPADSNILDNEHFIMIITKKN
jgi:hypothetical protein